MPDQDARTGYNASELICVMSARALNNGDVVFGGAGLPLVSAILAQNTHAPQLTILFEGGVIGPRVIPGRLPPSTNEARCAWGASKLLSITDVLLLMQRGYVDYGFLGGAQIDRHGNLNSSFIGDPDNPKVRLPGTGGANDIASMTKVIVAMRHEKRRFVEDVDFITSPGYLQGGRSRRDAGLPAGGIHLVITHLGLLDFNVRQGRMRLKSLHPGVDLEEVREKTGFELLIPKKVPRTKPPTAKELADLRSLDPDGRYTGGG
ncbi:MAG: CoA-transferase [Nitrospinota bacterium]|jgi:glutaconate CoA-transferase subunit B|nr:CoA-transferase [Nitrospinota bacterium]MDP6620340.1 CoA-transferase [Nitrospinota bacterium]